MSDANDHEQPDALAKLLTDLEAFLAQAQTLNETLAGCVALQAAIISRLTQEVEAGLQREQALEQLIEAALAGRSEVAQ